MLITAPKIDFLNPDYLPVIKWRAQLVDKIGSSRDLTSAAIAHYRYDLVGFIEAFGWTSDPRRQHGSKVIPFMPFERQKEYLNWVKDRLDAQEDGVVEKCREVGVSWLSVAIGVWMYIFRPGCQVGYCSATIEKLDKAGDMSTLFEKIRFFIRMLPPFLKPSGLNEDRHFNFKRILNPENGASIVGEGGKNPGRSGRSSIYFIDEVAFYEHPLKVEAALSETSNVKISMSTHNGFGLFYDKTRSGNYPLFTFNWRQDPRKDQSWYDDRKKKMLPHIFAQEVDCDPEQTLDNVCITATMISEAEARWRDMEPSGEIIAGLDVANDGGDKNAFCVRHGNKVIHMEQWARGNTSQTALRAYNLCLKFGVKYLFYDNIGVGAGVRGKMWELAQSKSMVFQAIGVNVGSKKIFGAHYPGKLNKDSFTNLKSLLWFKLRRGLEEEGFGLIPIPELRRELISQTYEFDLLGKIKMTSKVKLSHSPNMADALVLTMQDRPMDAAMMRAF